MLKQVLPKKEMIWNENCYNVGYAGKTTEMLNIWVDIIDYPALS